MPAEYIRKTLTTWFPQVNCDSATYFEIEDHWVIPHSACASSSLAFLTVQIMLAFPHVEIVETIVSSYVVCRHTEPLLTLLATRCRVHMACIRQSRPDSSLRYQVKVLQSF